MAPNGFDSVPYTIGYPVTKKEAEARRYFVNGRRKWYAPWSRYPGAWHTPSSMEEIGEVFRKAREAWIAEMLKPSPFAEYLNER